MSFNKRVSQFEYPNVMEVVDDRLQRGDGSVWSINEEGNIRSGSDVQGVREAQAREIGRLEGEARAKANYEEQARKDLDRMTDALRAFEGERARYFDKIEGEVVQLALAIARRILHREMQLDPDLLSGLIHYTLQKLRDGTRVKLKVHPADAGRLERKFGELVQICPDVQMLTGQCAVETEVGTTAVGVDEQLKEIEQGLLDLLAQRPAGGR